jgi:hypothetical protein
MKLNSTTHLEMTAMVLFCGLLLGCARTPQVKDSEMPPPNEALTTEDNVNPDTSMGTFELVEIDSLEKFRTIYLAEPTLYLGHDTDWEYLGGIGSDRVYKASRKTVDRQALQNVQAERSKIKYVPGGPPFGHKRSKEFLDWLKKAKLVED